MYIYICVYMENEHEPESESQSESDNENRHSAHASDKLVRVTLLRRVWPDDDGANAS